MKLGIIGLPSSGKTTIFNALTKGDAPTGQSLGGRFDVLTAVVDVYDERVDVLTGMFNPKKITYAKITYTDIAGIKKGANDGGGMSTFLLTIREASVAAMFTLLDDGKVKVSMRAEPEYNVAELAAELGGGGHPPAAGVTLDMTLDDAIEAVVPRLKAILRQS